MLHVTLLTVPWPSLAMADTNEKIYYRVRNEKFDINETNWTPNQYTEYVNLYLKTAKRAALNP